MPNAIDPPEFLGTRGYSQSLAGLWIVETYYSPYCLLPPHEHDDPFLCILLAGRYEETTGTKKLTVAPGTLVGHPAGSRHADQFSAAGGRCLCLVPNTSWLEDELFAECLREYCHKSVAMPSDALTRLQRELYATEAPNPLALAAAVFDFLATIRRRMEALSAPRWLKVVVERLDAEHLAPPTLLELAGEVGVHPAHLARTFRQFKGESIGHYVRRRRLDSVLRHLAGSRTPLSELALAGGFADQAHLARTVKRATGMTPSAYRRAMQSGRHAGSIEDCAHKTAADRSPRT